MIFSQTINIPADVVDDMINELQSGVDVLMSDRMGSTIVVSPALSCHEPTTVRCPWCWKGFGN